ncbi:dolichyl-diphosphooligosaccharide-protein glycotransferase [Sporobolomyces koalae]|uniref:dolichyl-diphosphooligosaccharide-protein glycotransferase n=1 Tax=Sporobolomyces koalae TaxID=500713 RepID=UPI00316D0B8A
MFSSFWQNLRDTGYEAKVQSFEAAAVSLKQGAGRAEHIIIFSSASKGVPAELAPQRLSTLVDAGTNILLAVPPTSAELWRDFAREFEVDYDDRLAEAHDHFGPINGSHTALVLPLDEVASPFLSATARAGPPVLYRGGLHTNGRSPLLNSILVAPATAYSAQPDSPVESLRSYGRQSSLVSAFQARNNARVTFVGSVDLFTDAAAETPVQTAQSAYPRSGNSAFTRDLAQWTFGARGHRRVVSVQHGLVGSDVSNPLSYRVRDKMYFTLEVEAPEEDSPTDLQLGFTMLDPHLRIPLISTRLANGHQRFEASLTVPDRHGVFTLRVDHRRSGWDNLESATVVSITPPRHDEYDRFIRGALPYYGSAFSVSLGLVVFLFFWILKC